MTKPSKVMRPLAESKCESDQGHHRVILQFLIASGSSQWVLSSFDGVLCFVQCLRHLAAASRFACLKEGYAIELLDCGVLIASLMICDNMT